MIKCLDVVFYGDADRVVLKYIGGLMVQRRHVSGESYLREIKPPPGRHFGSFPGFQPASASGRCGRLRRLRTIKGK
jgi:hypothetical protein